MQQHEPPMDLSGAVDLSAFDSPTTAPDPTGRADATPGDFRIDLVGDRDGRAQVLLAFGHVQWLFEPHLAHQLGQVLTAAAQRAEDHNSGVVYVPDVPATTPVGPS